MKPLLKPGRLRRVLGRMSDREKLELEAKLERCRQLAREYLDGPTAENIRQIEAELRQGLARLQEGLGGKAAN